MLRFNIIPEFRCKYVTQDVTIEDLVSKIKNPDEYFKNNIEYMRGKGKGSSAYESIKATLPCFIPMFKHQTYVKGETRTESNNLLYLDIDYCLDNFDFSLFPFVIAAWKSVSGVGTSILVSVDGMDKNTSLEELRHNIKRVGDMMAIEVDTRAISTERCCVMSYDKNAYYNPQHTSIEYTLPSTDSVLPTVIKKTSSITVVNSNPKKETLVNINKKNNKLKYSMRPFVLNGTEIRFSNIDDVVGNVAWVNGEKLRDLGKGGKVGYLGIGIPSVIRKGRRYKTLYDVFSAVMVLNRNLSQENLLKIVRRANKNCEEMLDDAEVRTIAKKAYARKDKEIINNKSKRFIKNPDCNMTHAEIMKEINVVLTKEKAGETDKKITNCLDNWNFEDVGIVNYKKIATMTGLSVKTVQRRKSLVGQIAAKKYGKDKCAAAVLKF